jgi:hypothetical protein
MMPELPVEVSSPFAVSAVTTLYPDIAPHGSLALAVRDLAATHGLDLGSVGPAPEPGWVLCGAVLESDAGKVRLLLGSQERAVMATCWRRGVELASGSAPELLPVARAAEAFFAATRWLTFGTTTAS